jgi:F0F1-type ATP synthase membrane subunit c/vacuolar-type H+-ATPase subunit K
MSKFLKSWVLTAALLGTAQPGWSHSEVSEASALSMLPVAVSVAAPAMLLSGGLALTVVSVQASAVGTVWVLERASDGARMTLNFSGQALTGAALSVGAAVVVTAMSTGWVLSAAGQAIAFVPNEIGRSLLHNERITR